MQRFCNSGPSDLYQLRESRAGAFVSPARRDLWQDRGALMMETPMPRPLIPALALGLLCTAPLWASPSVIETAEAQRSGAGWRISVTLSHPDTGWDHYADGWEVLTPDGVSLGTRVLAHPHVEEQPFTRSLGGVRVPEGVTELVIRARCNLDGYTGTPLTLRLLD